MTSHQTDIESLRAEIASIAARMIAEDGSDYHHAKQKAARQVLGNGRIAAEALPDNAQIEEEVRIYHQIFHADTQPLRLRTLREFALQWMQKLASFQPYLVGAVLNGSAGEHSDIHLHLFTDSAKDVEIFLLNANVNFEVSESHLTVARDQAAEIISFLWRNEGVVLTIFESNEQRQIRKSPAGRKMERANIEQVQSLLKEEQE